MNKFLILGTQRTGSTALYRAFNFHPEIACGNEWTQGIAAWRKLAVTETSLGGDFSVLKERQRKLIGAVYGESTRWLGFKLLFRSSAKWLLHPQYAPALWFDRFPAYLRWLSERPSISVIHIQRTDPIEWLKSKYVADSLKSYATREYPEDIRVRVPVKEALRRLESKRWIDRRLGSLASTNPYIAVKYEDFLESDRAVLLRVLQFLGCDPAKLGDFNYRKQTKQSQRPPSEYIANYQELTGALRQHDMLGIG